MSKPLVLFILVSLFASYACEEEEPDFLKEEVTLSLNQCEAISGQYKLCLDSISDSRCPLNVECVWAGEVVVDLWLRSGDLIFPFRLCLGDSDECKHSDNIEGLAFRLLTVDPFPNADKPTDPGEYEVKIQISLSATQRG